MNAPELCPARHRAEEEGGHVLCDSAAERPPAQMGFICWRCLEIMLRRAKDREAQRQEWEV
jgi:hypothetical protein